MRLHENQLGLLWHLALFNLLDYESCLVRLDTGTGTATDRTSLSYAFRPLTKNDYVVKRSDGSVSILAKGRNLFPELEPLISTGGKGTERRVMEVSRMAMWMWKQGFPPTGELPEEPGIWFIPSACWRKIAPGILSTTRFTGMLVGGGRRLAVYDVDDGHMEWQACAENSLFYTKHGNYETKATGMLLVCREDMREAVAQNVIRQTMWQRRQLLRNRCLERNKPARWSQSPIKINAKYEHVYLTTPNEIRKSVIAILKEESWINELSGESGVRLGKQESADIEIWPRRLFVSPATDLLKYVRFFDAVKSWLHMENHQEWNITKIKYELYAPAKDEAIVRMYQDVNEAKGASLFLFR